MLFTKMLGFKNCIKFITICSILMSSINAHEGHGSLSSNAEELNEMKERNAKAVNEYSNEVVKEVHTLLGPSTWKFINSEATALNWWNVDNDRRYNLAVSKLPLVLSSTDENVAFNQLKAEYNEGLNFADKFWRAELQNVLKKLKDNLEDYKKPMSPPPPRQLEYTALNTSQDVQNVFRNQMHNLTDVAARTKAVVRAYLSHLKPNLPDKSDVSYDSLKAKYDMVNDKFTVTKTGEVQDRRNLVAENLSKHWHTGGKNGPTQEEFDKEYNDLTEYATNLVQNLGKSFFDQYPQYAN